MAYSADMFSEILDDDVIVDKEKLIIASFYGIPDSVRSKVWLYLLNVSDCSHQFEAQQSEERIKYYKNLRPTAFLYIKNEVNTAIHNMSLTHMKISAGISNVLSNYFSCNPKFPFSSGIVSLTIPIFIATDHNEATTFFLLTNLIDKWYFQINSDLHIKQSAKLAKYISIFLPELANHFNSEALDTNEVFIHWFQFLHSTALPITSLLRLWDTYFSLNSQDLSKKLLFVSLALVERLMPKILRLEHIEIKNFLSHLPHIDVDLLLIQAQTLQSQFISLFSTESVHTD